MTSLKDIDLFYAGFEWTPTGGYLRHRFVMHDKSDGVLATIPVQTSDEENSTLSSQTAQAHQILAARLRKWADDLDQSR